MPLFGAYLKHVRSEAGLTLRSIAQSLSVDPSYMSRLERGEVANPADEILDKLPDVLNRPREEVYLAAGRITPEFSAVLEQGIPYTLTEAAPMLAMISDQFGGMYVQLGGLYLESMFNPSDAEAMARIHSVITHVAELVQAMEKGRISQQQFDHVTETIKQVKLALLSAAVQSETP
ncbi:MAG TPA: helix-turn-helix transcriptional regulator [Symbiobacteriaceae bacterium]|nr:helix-turn-helix transcriptional regulator [Symbiobacteriaceae bacterium]